MLMLYLNSKPKRCYKPIGKVELESLEPDEFVTLDDEPKFRMRPRIGVEIAGRFRQASIGRELGAHEHVD